MRVIFGTALALAVAGSAAAAGAPTAQTFGFDPKTKVDGPILQVIHGDRAIFRLDDGGLPVLDAVEKGALAAAHPPGAVAEAFPPPGPGLVAAALDGSVEKKASVLKVWNTTGHPLEFRVVALVKLQGDVLRPVEPFVCPVAPGGVRTETWPAPVVAVGLSRFKPASKQALARCAAKPPVKKGK